MKDVCDVSRGSPRLVVGLVTDLHYAPTTVGSRHCSESIAKLQEAVHTFRTRNVDLVINLGDSIDACGSADAALARLKEVDATLAASGIDTYALVGNHDVEELTHAQVLAARKLPSAHRAFDCAGVHIVLLDSNLNPDGSSFSKGDFAWNDAWIGEAQMRWLKADLEASAGKPTLVFCHANLDDRRRANGALNGHIVRDAAEVRHILEEAGSVIAVLQGHDHKGFASSIHGIPTIGLRAMVEGSGLEQNAYALLSPLPDGGMVLEGFGQQPSLCFSGQGYCEQ